MIVAQHVSAGRYRKKGKSGARDDETGVRFDAVLEVPADRFLADPLLATRFLPDRFLASYQRFPNPVGGRSHD